VSVPEARSVPGARVGFTCAPLATDIIELVTLRDRIHVLKALGARRGLSFPAFGRIATARDTLVLGVRPERWLLLTPPAPPGAALANWQGACAACAAAVELSSALTALHLTGPAVREVLARGCRLDLHPEAFAPGTAAASQMAQVPVVLGALPAGWLLLTPSSTARHFREWLGAAAAPFGLEWRGSVTVTTLNGEKPA
jgi:heterotetrameric sarcosine oxidase gamma subunit